MRYDVEDTALNRTILELKRKYRSVAMTTLPSLNRTILELKHIWRSLPDACAVTLNRTILELKQYGCA